MEEEIRRVITTCGPKVKDMWRGCKVEDYWELMMRWSESGFVGDYSDGEVLLLGDYDNHRVDDVTETSLWL